MHIKTKSILITCLVSVCLLAARLPVAAAGADEKPGEDQSSGGTVREISEKFRQPELEKLRQVLVSPEFQAQLLKYNCGEPLPKLTFPVSIRPKGYATTRAVEITYPPGISPGGRTRCLMFGIDYLLDKAVAKLDPDPHMEETRAPVCDCSKRDGQGEWVEFPGPDEILAVAKVAAKNAARQADEAVEQKESDLQSIRLDPRDVVIEPSTNEMLNTREISLGKPPAGITMLAIDRGGRHWAGVISRVGKQAVMLDGVEGPLYDEIPDHQQLEFSADGNHFAYIARRGDKKLVVLDGKEGPAYNVIEEMFHPIFSPDALHFAYIASRPAFGFSEKSFVVLDGREQKSYELVEAIQFSPDGKHLAYDAQKIWNHGAEIVLDEKDGKTYDGDSGGCFSAEGNHFTYVAFNRTNRSPGSLTRSFVVVDGKEKKPFQEISAFLHFSPDGQHLAYVAHEGSSGMHILVRDDIETRYANVQLGPFSPDSRHLATLAFFATNWLVLIDGRVLESQDRLASSERSFGPVNEMTFSPDGRHLAYAGRGTTTNWSVFLDGHAIKADADCDSPVFSPGVRSATYQLAWMMERDGKKIPVLAGREGKAYDKILVWRSDVLEDRRPAKLWFDDAGLLHAVAMRDGEILRLEMQVVRPL